MAEFQLTKQACAEVAMLVPTFRGQAGIPGQGPYFIIQISVEHGDIQSVRFDSVPCVWSSAIGMVVAGFLEHTAVRDLGSRINRDAVLERLQGIPGSKLEFVELAMQAYQRLYEELAPTLVSHG